MADVKDLITDNIDIWTSAVKRKSSSGRGSGKKDEIYGVKKLRELILDLAVRGLLVPQDPSDEPASVLLERIAAEKTELIKTNKIKKQKALPEIADDEKPFELPDGWEWCHTQDIAHTITSGSRDWAKFYSDNGAIFVTMGNLSKNGYRLRMENIRYVNPPEHGEGSRTKLQENDLLISVTGDVGNLGLIPADFGVAYINQHTAMLRLMPECQGRFFPEIFQSPIAKNQFTAPQRGVKNSFRLGDIGEMSIPCPPKAEQHRIVAKVDELMALCDQLEQQTEASLTAHQTLVKTLLDALTQAATQQTGNESSTASTSTPFEQAWQRLAEHFDTVFTTEDSIDQLKQTILQLAVMGKLVPQDPNDEPASELLKRIAVERGAHKSKIKGSKSHHSSSAGQISTPFASPPGWCWVQLGEITSTSTGRAFKSSEYSDSGIFVLRVTNINEDGSINLSDCKYIPPSLAADTYSQFALSDGDLLLVMVGGSLGKIGVVDSTVLPAVLNQNMWKFDRSKNLSSEYLKQGLAYINRSQLDITKSTHGHLAQGQYLRKLFPLPPIKEQHRIVAKVNELKTICDQLNDRLTQAQTIQLQLADTITKQAINQ